MLEDVSCNLATVNAGEQHAENEVVVDTGSKSNNNSNSSCNWNSNKSKNISR